VGDFNSDGRLTRSEAKLLAAAAKKDKAISVAKFESLPM
jgi:hypothetical protein